MLGPVALLLPIAEGRSEDPDDGGGVGLIVAIVVVIVVVIATAWYLVGPRGQPPARRARPRRLAPAGGHVPLRRWPRPPAS